MIAVSNCCNLNSIIVQNSFAASKTFYSKSLSKVGLVHIKNYCSVTGCQLESSIIICGLCLSVIFILLNDNLFRLAQISFGSMIFLDQL